MSKATIPVDAESSRRFLTDFLGQPPVEPKPRSEAAPTEEPKEQPEPIPEPKPEPKPERKEPKGRPEPKVSEVQKPVKKPSPKAKEPAPTPTPEPEEEEPRLDVAQLVDQTARAVAREVRGSQLEEKPEYRVVEPEIPAEERKLQAHLVELEKLYPENYGKIATQRKKFVEKLRTYEKKWLDEHPGEDFNPDAEEHNDFYESDPLQNVSQEHLAEAIAEVRVQERVAQLESKVEASERRREVEPRAAGEAARVARSVVEAIDGDAFGSLVKADGTIDTAAAQKAEEADPIRAPIVVHAAREAARMSGEMVKLYSGVVQPDPRNNNLHRQLLNFGQEVERRMLAAKPSHWKDPRGRAHSAFLPSDEYWNLPESQRRKYWTFDAEDMAGFVAQEVQNDAKVMIDREEKRFQTVAQKRGLGVPAGGKKPAEKTGESEPEPEKSEEKPSSPSGRGAPNMAGPKGGTVTVKESSQKGWLDSFLGKA